MKYTDKVFHLRDRWRSVRDSRPRPQIPAHVFPAVFFAMFTCRIGSFNELEQHRGRPSWRRWLGRFDLPSADELAYVSERIETDDLRTCLGQIYTRLKRNKVLAPRRGWMLAAIDGHEINSSYKRCCDHCLEREIEVGGRIRTQYYHRLVAFQIVAGDFHFLLDLELLAPGEDEVAAALRLLDRVLRDHPRCFDILVADALYLRPSMIDFVRTRGKHLIAVLKANQPELLLEAKTLMGPVEPVPAAGRKPRQTIGLRDMEGFTTETITESVRVVWSHEETVSRERIGREWETTGTTSDWLWATTMPQSLAPAETIAAFGHDRWKIENEGFNELVTHWHANHYFHHHANSIVVLWLMLFMAHAVFHCFHRRNLAPPIRKAHTAIHIAKLAAASLRGDNWWPPPPT